MKAIWKHLTLALGIALLTALPLQVSAEVTEVMCIKTNTGNYFPVVRVSMMVVADGSNTFEIVLKDGEGEANVESISFETHEEDIDFSKYNITSEETSIDMTKKIFMITSTGKYLTFTSLPVMTVKEGTDLFEIQIGDEVESNVSWVEFYRGDEPEPEPDTQIGDIDGNGELSVTDAVLLVNYILGQSSVDVKTEIADMNGDGYITVTDVVAIVNNVLGLTSTATKAPSTLYTDSSMWIENADLQLGTTVSVPVMLNSDRDFTAMQFDIKLPEGLVMTNAEASTLCQGHDVAWNMIADGCYRVIVYSLSSNSFSSREGEVVKLGIMANNPEVTGEIVISESEVSSANGVAYKLTESKGTNGLGFGINSTIANNTMQLLTPISSQITISGCGKATDAIVYAMDGRQVASAPINSGMTTIQVGHLSSGMYIVQIGRKALKFMKK